MTYTIHVDGGSRGNPGPSAAAFIVHDDRGAIVHRQGIALGTMTNNQAEYHGVIAALRWVHRHAEALQSVVVILDSELLVNQLTGVFRIKSPGLRRLAVETKSLERTFPIPVRYRHVRREENREADKIVNATLDQAK